MYENVEDKKEFFEIYENIKKGIISLEDLLVTDLIKVLAIMQEESQICESRIEEQKSENLKLEQEIKILKAENQSLQNN